MYIHLFCIVKADVCKEFDPSNPDHMAAVGDDVEKLKHLVELRKYQILVIYFPI